VRIRDECEVGEALMQHVWSSFNNWIIIISQEKWPRTEEKKLIFICTSKYWHLLVRRYYGSNPTSLRARWVSLYPLGVSWCDIDKRVQWRRDRACVLNPDTCNATSPTCSKTGPARAACARYSRPTLRYARFHQTQSWNGKTHCQYSCALERDNNILLQLPTQPSLSSLPSSCSPSLYLSGPRELPPKCKCLIQACTDSAWTSTEENASIIVWKLICPHLTLKKKERRVCVWFYNTATCFALSLICCKCK